MYQRGRPLHKYVGSSYYKLCPWQRTNSWGKNATWQEWTRAIFRLAGQTPAPELSPQRLFTWPTGERERERERQSWHREPLTLSPPSLTHNRSLSLYVSFWWQRLNLRTISPMLRKGHQYPVILFITFHLFHPPPPLDALPGSAVLVASWRKFRSTWSVFSQPISLSFSFSYL